MRVFWLPVIVAVLTGCHSMTVLDASAPALEAVAEAGIRGIDEPGFPQGGEVQLADGAWQGAPFAPGAASRPAVMMLRSPVAGGDLDGDGAHERIALFAASSGGSGERMYLAVFGARDGRALHRATILVGDRSKPRALAIEGGEIVLDVVETGEGEPACCGTQLGRHRYRLEGNALHEVAHEIQGVLSMNVLEGEWQLVELGGEPLPEGVRAPSIAFREGAVSGFAGCNRYSGALSGATAGEFAPGPHAFATTRMACPPPQSALEDRYLAAMTHAARYGFVAGRLMLECVDGERRTVLLFAR
jgi:heat shock protein HslJ